MHTKIDLDKLSKFMTLDMMFRKRMPDGSTHFIRARHRECSKEDFTKRGYNSLLPSKYSTYICL